MNAKRIVLAMLTLVTGVALAQPIQLTYWYGQSDRPGEAHQELVRRFNASQDQVQVTAQYQGDYYDVQQKLTAAIAARTVPDVVNLEVTAVVPFARAGVLTDLEPFVNEAYNLGDIPEALLNDGYIADGLYALPFARSTPVLYYNPDLLETAGLPARAPQNWDEFGTWIKQVATIQPDTYGLCHNQDTWSITYTIRSSGGQISDEGYNWLFANDSASVEAVERWTGYFAPGGGGRFFPQGTENGADVEFANGRCAIILQSTGSMGGIVEAVGERFEVGVGYIPAGEERFVPTGGNSVAILNSISGEEKAAAWAFVAFMTSPESTAWLSEYTGYLPMRESVIGSPEMEAVYEANPNFRVAVEQLEFAQPQELFMHVPEGQQYIMNEAIERVILEGVPVQASLDEAAQELTGATERNGFYQ